MTGAVSPTCRTQLRGSMAVNWLPMTHGEDAHSRVCGSPGSPLGIPCDKSLSLARTVGLTPVVVNTRDLSPHGTGGTKSTDQAGTDHTAARGNGPAVQVEPTNWRDGLAA